ncbi:MAG: glycosyltransferase [Bacteroidota bacterium]|nr:glycosyltransferase [Bacteroidota bacterium]
MNSVSKVKNQNNSLAIVIPAFKKKFFDNALRSIVKQTNKNFTVYVGDDKSAEDLQSIVEKYRDQIAIFYEKFEANLGSTSIVAHWERCVALTTGEDWIWLFSDDDIMSENCVQLFFDALDNTKAEHDVYRFNCCIINSAGKSITEKSQYPKIQTSSQFLLSRLSYQFHSYIVNCIFSRNAYNRHSGFVDISAAWGSDDAAWILFAQEKKIFTIDGGLIKWRQSNLNISGNTTNGTNRSRKYKGMQEFIEWMYSWAKKNKIKIDPTVTMKWYWVMLKSIGFKERFWPYIKSKSFRKFFWRTQLVYQMKLIIKGY